MGRDGRVYMYTAPVATLRHLAAASHVLPARRSYHLRHMAAARPPRGTLARLRSLKKI